MRSKERIKIFFNKMDLHFVLKTWFPNMDEETRQEMYQAIYPKLELVEEAWYENPNWRFGQVLVNLDIIPNTPGLWYYMEEDDLLLKQGVPARECLLWGNNFDKDMNRLPKTIWKPIKDMNTDHIQNILDNEWTGNSKYIKAFKAELQLRQE